MALTITRTLCLLILGLALALFAVPLMAHADTVILGPLVRDTFVDYPSGGIPQFEGEYPSGDCSQVALTLKQSGVCVFFYYSYSWGVDIGQPSMNPGFIVSGGGSYFIPGSPEIVSASPTSEFSGNAIPGVSVPGSWAEYRGSSFGTQTVTYTSSAITAPTVTLTATPASIVSGSSSTLTWSSTDATFCTGTNFSTRGALSGTFSVSPTETTRYSVTCTGAGGSATDSATVVVTQGIDNNPPDGESDGGGPESPGGGVGGPGGGGVSQCNDGIDNDHDNKIDMADADCSSLSDNNEFPVIITPPPATLSLTANPTLVKAGAATQLTWLSSDAVSCTLAGDNGNSWTGLSGTKISTPLSRQTTFTLRCTGTDGGHPSTAVTVKVQGTIQEF